MPEESVEDMLPGAAHPARLSWAEVVQTHRGLLPLTPGPWLGTKTPAGLHMVEAFLRDREATARGVHKLMAGCWRRVYGDDRFDIECPDEMDLIWVEGALDYFHTSGVIPAEWFFWRMHLWTSLAQKAKDAGERVWSPRPRVDWLLDPIRMKKHYGWYAHDPQRRLGGQTHFSERAREYGRSYLRLQIEMCEGEMPSTARAEALVEKHMQGLDASVLKAEADASTRALVARVNAWEFVW